MDRNRSRGRIKNCRGDFKMKLRDDLENKILKSVIKELHKLTMHSWEYYEEDMWIDVYDKVDDATYSVNISWEY